MLCLLVIVRDKLTLDFKLKMDENSSICSSESVTLLKPISLLSGELTTKERFGIYCKPSFELRRLKNKGAILVLIWSFLCMTVPWFCLERTGSTFEMEFYVHLFAFGLTLSIAGWIADVRFGRYRVISLSMWMMWAALMLDILSSVSAKLLDSYSESIHRYASGVLWIVVAIGFGGFQANIIQFGIDQLHCALTSEIASFILWYVWTYSGSGLVVRFIFGYLPMNYLIVGNLVVCICLCMALSSMLMFNHWLVKEPVTQNPFKLVYSVVRYAVKHKHPEYRSAFTYCEEEPPSRVDFGKSKYGGPFTTEQVEDVKTCLRFTVIIPVGTVILGVIFDSWLLLNRITNLLNDTCNYCSSVAFVEFSLNCSVVVLPLYEVFFYPVFHRCLVMVKSSWTITFGMLLLTVKIIAVLVIEIMTRRQYLESTNYNATIPCIVHGALNTTIDFQWVAVPLLLHSLSGSVLGIGGLKFIVSQTPYLMRGLIMGSSYSMLILCVPVMIGISIPFTRDLSIWGHGIINCGFWYALLLLVVEVLVGFMLIAMQRWYKKRKREDVLPNEHIFAERYYDRDA